jgi:hypothetical protein
MRRLALIAAALAAMVAAAPGEEAPAFDPKAYPPDVQAVLQTAHKVCTDAEGVRVTFAENTVRKLDLTGDGRADYIVDFRNTHCEEREWVYCGTGGCEVVILVALPNGRYRTVFSDVVRGYDIRPGRGARRIRFDLHGGYCGLSGPSECTRTRRITAKSFAFRQK